MNDQAQPKFDYVSAWLEAQKLNGLLIAAQGIADQLVPIDGGIPGLCCLDQHQTSALNAVIDTARKVAEELRERMAGVSKVQSS
jgi:hypothetical protein